MHAGLETLVARPSSQTGSSQRNPGHGSLEVRQVAGRSVVIRAQADSPLRLLTPSRCPGKAAWVYSSTFGGGLVSGDKIDLNVRVGPGAMCALSTQASTKIYRASNSKPTTQSLKIDLGPDSICVILPDPVTCFNGAIFEQQICVSMTESSSLVLVDWMSSGRLARGERWAFERYRSSLNVSLVVEKTLSLSPVRGGGGRGEGRTLSDRESRQPPDRPLTLTLSPAYRGEGTGEQLIFRDALLLDITDGPIGSEHRMGRCDCFGTILMLGPRVKLACAALFAWADAQTVARGQELIFSASPLRQGAVIRVAGPGTEIVGRWMREKLKCVPELLDGDPWARKW